VIVGRRLSHARHLAVRFVGSLSLAPPSTADEAWVAAVLGAGEHRIWRQLSPADRRHAVGVARRVQATGAGPPERWVLAAALLHDCGKLDSGLGTFGRVGATLWAAARGHRRAALGPGRVARYLRHPEIGAALLREAGAHPHTSAWAAEHHLPPDRWTVPPAVGRVLKDADDD
jgi:hypothetical protein